MDDQPAVITFLFTDIEGSTRLWEAEPERMRSALARHDAIARAAVEGQRGTIVKMTGDGIHAAFAEPLDALCAAMRLQQALADPGATEGIGLAVRCGLHVGAVERRDNDYFGVPVNRAARIMAAANGGQVLLSEALARMVADRLPEGAGLRDLGAVRLRDLADRERVYQLQLCGLRQDFPALRSLEATPNNLPQQMTSFVGRERELTQVKRLLVSARLLTLVGVGGLGKTRLSLQAAAEVTEQFPDGVWLVELAAIFDPQLVPQAAAAVLGVKEEAGRPVEDALDKFVRDRQLLLVLDNCEHLVDACAVLAKSLLQAGPRLTILATSREPMRVAGETVYPLPALAVPEAEPPSRVDALMDCEAVRLFIARAQAAQPAFRMTAHNAPAIADICRRLDGIPLAIELAAARARSLPVDVIAARLSDRFRLLNSGERTALPRQQTLRALIDWSYDLLSAAERALFRRLAVFAGGWTLETAEAVAAGDDASQAAVLDHLTDLVDKSLVTVEAEGRRYGFLETVRQYAGDRLQESGEAPAVRARHLHFYVAFAERARAGLLGGEQGRWLALQNAERDNLLAAHEWCDHAVDGAQTGLRLAIATKFYWLYSGAAGLGYRLTQEAIRRPGVAQDSPESMQAFYMLGQFCASIGRYQEALPYLDRALAIARNRGDRRRTAGVLHVAAAAAMGLGRLPEARAQLEEALALARELGNRREMAAYLIESAQLERLEGRGAAAEPLYEQALRLAREIGDREVSAVALLNLAMIMLDAGDARRAVPMLAEAADIAVESASKPIGQNVLDVCMALAAIRGHTAPAARFMAAAEALLRESGMQRHPADMPFVDAAMARLRSVMGDGAFERAGSANCAAMATTLVEARDWVKALR